MPQQSIVQILTAIAELYQHTDLTHFPPIVLRTLRSLVPQDIASYTEVDFCTGQVAGHIDSPQWPAEEIAQRLSPYVNIHPLIRHFNQTGDGTAHRITDFMTQREFEKSELYRAVYEPMGVRRQMSIGIQTPELVLVGAVSSRGGRDFSERDRTVLNLLRPHLVVAYRNARAITALQREREQLDQIARGKGFGIVMTTAAGKIDSLIGAAGSLLDAFFDAPAASGRLPEELRDWMTDTLNAPLDLAPRPPLEVVRHGERLSVRLLRASAGVWHTLVLEPVLPKLPAGPLRAHGLTDRQIEVLRYITDGKSNQEIATALRAQPKTIQKHLEHIYEKLQVQSRGAAAAKARALCFGT